MKKTISTILLSAGTIFLSAQITQAPVKQAAGQQLQVKNLPAGKAVLVRTKTIDLKIQLTRFSDSVTIFTKEIDAAVASVKSKQDSMSEMGETESLRLQMAMDRLSKMMSTLSNMLKKINETSQTITQNLK